MLLHRTRENVEMCGFAGYIDLQKQSSDDDLRSNLARMTQRIHHRGPDDSGAWVDQEHGVALGHRRLSIVDLSPSGHQPMSSQSQRYVIVYNGEIYNFKSIRKQLEQENVRFVGESDTEVLLAAIESWGLEKAITESVGMFAFALWDKKRKQLTLGRDRLGEKPLYYGFHGKRFVFGSELKAFAGLVDWDPQINRDSITQLLRFNYIPAPYSIFQGIYKLSAGCTFQLNQGIQNLEISPFPNSQTNALSPQRYWSFSKVVKDGQNNPLQLSDGDVVNKLESLLTDSVDQQMFADVPVGALLSGGIDSSTIVALMQKLNDKQVHTFSIGFEESGYNEAEYAKQVAEHLGTQHTELYVSPEQALSVIPELPTIYDEPFSDSSQIPTYLVSKLAREHVTVALSGDAGDELFGGYNRYTWGQTIWSRLAWMPVLARNTLASAITKVTADQWQSMYVQTRRLGRVNGPAMAFGDRMHKLADVMRTASQEDLYLNLISHWKSPEHIVLGGSEPETEFAKVSDERIAEHFVAHMMHVDTLTYLPDDILAKVDRASMAVSLEMRVPFLDHRIVEFAAHVPLEQKIKNGQGKWLLREVLHRYVPQQMIDRPKMGFGVPIDHWLRGPLRDWAENLLDADRLRQEGYFQPEPIREKWQQHVTGERNWQYYLWDVLMFQAWLENTNR